ncbi:synaptotagmin 15b [Helobdella robusta]|uniref:Synaptotagmin 15b n=1 Tax=Helobdella robusta TaxID=6412 RepID=T1F2Z8_HELRO|nr:synaptotagmin 15b [Helobdella robusta]ESO07090.1 synaptotagmin 15b [Helobdella robusta]
MCVYSYAHLPCSHAEVLCTLVLLPDLRSQVRTSFKKKTCNPKFDETFVFQVPVKDFEERILKLTACDVDRLRRHNVIGHVIYPLKTSGVLADNAECGKKITVIRDLDLDDCIENSSEDKGELLISMTYNAGTERLNVGVYEGRNIKKIVESKNANFYAKVALMKNHCIVKSKRTDTIKDDRNPKFNESLSFKQPNENSLMNVCIVVSIFQNLHAQRDKMVGRVVIGPYMFARGKELEHWNEVMTKPLENITYWHNIT